MMRLANLCCQLTAWQYPFSICMNIFYSLSSIERIQIYLLKFEILWKTCGFATLFNNPESISKSENYFF